MVGLTLIQNRVKFVHLCVQTPCGCYRIFHLYVNNQARSSICHTLAPHPLNELHKQTHVADPIILSNDAHLIDLPRLNAVHTPPDLLCWLFKKKNANFPKSKSVCFKAYIISDRGACAPVFMIMSMVIMPVIWR